MARAERAGLVGPFRKGDRSTRLRRQLLATTAVIGAVLLASAACDGAAPTHVPTRTPVVIAIPPTSTPTPVTLTPTLTPTPVAVTATPPPTPVVVTVVVTAPPPPTPVVVTATPTPTPAVVTATPAPTRVVVTATPTPVPPVPTAASTPPSGALITTADLPERFEYIPPDELDLQPGSSIDGTLVIAGSFAFESLEPPEVVFGYTAALTTTIDRMRFDAETSDPELFLGGLQVGWIEEALASVSIDSWDRSDPGIGDQSTRMTVQTVIDGVDVVLDVIGFRNGDTGAYIVKMYLPTQPTDTDLVHYARILDQRIVNPLAPPAVPVKPRLIFSESEWDSIQIQNAIARKIAKIGYGYETDSVYGHFAPLLEALERGDTNITMEIWLPRQREAYEAALALGVIVDLGKSLPDYWQSGFIIPQYTKDANPGLVSVEDLRKPEYMELFVTPESDGRARALGCLANWTCYETDEKKLVAYGLADFVSSQDLGSHAALDAEIIGAYEQRQDVLFYYWGPTVLTDRLQKEYGGYYILEEPEYTDACWAADKGCAYPISEIHISVRAELLEVAPDIVELLRNWDFNEVLLIAASNYLVETAVTYDEVAVWWLRNTDEWKEWVAPGVAEKVLAGL